MSEKMNQKIEISIEELKSMWLSAMEWENQTDRCDRGEIDEDEIDAMDFGTYLETYLDIYLD